MAFPRFAGLDRPGVGSWVYPFLRDAVVDREPTADAVLPASYDDASPEERVSIDRAVAAMVRELCGGEEVQHGLQ